jgi:DNA-binding NarL/FixJ family response regulator
MPRATQKRATTQTNGRPSGPSDAAQNGNGRLRVLVVDDDPVVRRAVRDCLQEAGLIVVAGAANGVEAVELGLHYKPDVILMDIAMPELDGMSAMQRILEKEPELCVIMLSASGDEEVGLRALVAGAAGCLSKGIDPKALPRAIRGVMVGEAAISRSLTMRLIEELRRLPEAGEGMRPVKSPLTTREWEVLDLMATGATTDSISETLVLSPGTVETHIKNILRKLGLHSRAAAVEAAQELRQPAPARAR